MNKEKFYYLGQKLYLTTVFIKHIEFYNTDIGKMIETNSIDYPIVFKQTKEGKRWSDVLDLRTIDKFLVLSNRFADVIKKNEFSGCKFVPVKIIGLEGNEIEGYTGMYVTGKSGKLSYENSEIIEREPFPGRGKLYKYYKGVKVVDWDGSDFFTPQDTKGIVVTQRVVDKVKILKLSNVMFADLDSVEIDDFTYNMIMERRRS